MSTRNLDALFAPRAIALIGASREPDSVGAVLARNLLSGGFAGPVMLVNRHETSILGAPVYRTVADLPQAPDLAIIATPAASVPGLISELGQRGCGAAVVISAGFEGEGPAASLRQAALDAAQPHDLRIVGPNCLGVLSPALGINASFAHRMPEAGGIALVTQSGAVAAAAIDWAPAHGVGFSRIVTIGDSLDVDLGDLVGWLADDPATSGILLYIESIGDARKFMAAGREATTRKPVAVIKAGRSAAGAKAAFSHTGALAGADAVYDAAFRRAGLVRVESLGELFDLGLAFSAGLASANPRLAILTNGGGAGVLAVDALETAGGELAILSDATLARLESVAPANWSRRNPVDILGDAHPDRYAGALGVLLDAPEADAVLVLNCPTAVADSASAAEAVIRAREAKPGHKPILTAWLGEAGMAQARRRLSEARLPTFDTPERAIGVFGRLNEARRRRELASRPLPPQPAAAPHEAREIVTAALAKGRSVLTDPEARALLRAYGAPTVQSLTAEDPEAAALAARRLGGPLALKILSRDISHKSEIGGVVLDLPAPADVELAARDMLARVRELRPNAIIDGFVLEPMVSRPRAVEMIVGLAQDPTFGPVLLVGHGGVAVEVLADRSLELPPLDRELALRMIGRTRVSRLLAGYRNLPPANTEALADVLVALSRIAADLPEVADLDINPLLCDAQGVLAVDARVALRADASARAHPALREKSTKLRLQAASSPAH